MSDRDFLLGHLPFWIVNYGLAVVMWSCIGRFMLFFVPALQPNNYIFRAFYNLTEWAVRCVRVITPAAVSPFWLVPITAFWLFHLRVVAFFVMAHLGMTPQLSPAGG
jgi:hypothetical protein